MKPRAPPQTAPDHPQLPTTHENGPHLMPEKYDGFGIAHRDTCRSSDWTIVPGRPATGPVQRCRSCGVIWRRTDGSLTPRPASYGTYRKKTR